MIILFMLGFLEKYNKFKSEGGLFNWEDVNCIFVIMLMCIEVDGIEVEVMVFYIFMVGYEVKLACYMVNVKYSLDELFKKVE